jgi:hypothetical protein
MGVLNFRRRDGCLSHSGKMQAIPLMFHTRDVKDQCNLEPAMLQTIFIEVVLDSDT